MTDALSAIAQILDRDVSQLRTIGQNVANSSTPGYRAVSEAMPAAPGQGAGPRTQVSMRAGSLMGTGRGLDLALTGEGFFAVSTPEGVRYTRNGHFQLKADGSLVTTAGAPVLGTDGALVLPDASVSIAPDGSIRSGNDVIGRLKVVAFAHPEQLQPAGDGLYRIEDQGSEAAGFEVHQGSLEGSNVEVSTELVNIIGLTRHLESVQRGVMAYDQMLNSGINEIGKPRS